MLESASTRARRAAAGALLGLLACGASAAEPPSAKALFAPMELRAFSFSPSGQRLLEVRSAARAGDDLKGLADLLAPGQSVAIHDLASGAVSTLNTGRGNAAVFTPRWLDDDHLLWHLGAIANEGATIERVKLLKRADGTLGIADIKVEARKAYAFGERQLGGARRLLVAAIGDDGESLYLVDPAKPFGAQLVAAARVAGPLLSVDRWVVDGAGKLAAVEVTRRRGDTRVLVPTASGWRAIHEAREADRETSAVVDVDDASGQLLVIDDHGADRAALREMDPRTGALGKQRFGDAVNNVSGAVRDPISGRLIGVTINDNQVRMEFFDARVRAIQDQLRAKLGKANVRPVAVAPDLKRVVVYAGGSDDPGAFHLYDAASGGLRKLGDLQPGLVGTKLSTSRAFTLKARDGLTLHGQYTPPVEPRGTRPALVLMPHGGPFGIRDYAHYDPEVQFLATRGYGVLQLDFRGSGGYGRDFLKAGFKEWGGSMQRDIVDAARWAIAQKLAEPGRICTYGGSYGGYAAVMGLIQDPELFACGITVSGVSDLTLLFRSDEVKANSSMREWMKDAIGDPEKERQRLNQASPAFLARGLKRPLLIGHGGKDARAEPEHAYRLRAAIEAGGGKVEWQFFAEEGHGFHKLDDQAAWMDAVAGFLDRNLPR